MQERVKLLGGIIDLKTAAGKGTLIQLKVPRFI